MTIIDMVLVLCLGMFFGWNWDSGRRHVLFGSSRQGKVNLRRLFVFLQMLGIRKGGCAGSEK